MYNLKFIRAEEEDVECIFLRVRSWMEYYNDTLNEEQLQDRLMEIYKRLRSDISYTYKVMYRTAFAGCYTLRRAGDHMVLEDFYIDKEYWSMRFGEAVIRRCISDCVLPVRTEVPNGDFWRLSVLVNNGFTIEEIVDLEKYVLLCQNNEYIADYTRPTEQDVLDVISESFRRITPRKGRAGRKRTTMTPFEKKYSVVGDVYSSGRKRRTPLVSKSVFGVYDQQLTGLQRLFYSAGLRYCRKRPPVVRRISDDGKV